MHISYLAHLYLHKWAHWIVFVWFGWPRGVVTTLESRWVSQRMCAYLESPRHSLTHGPPKNFLIWPPIEAIRPLLQQSPSPCWARFRSGRLCQPGRATLCFGRLMGLPSDFLGFKCCQHSHGTAGGWQPRSTILGPGIGNMGPTRPGTEYNANFFF